MTIKVSVVEDHQPYRAHLAALINGTAGFQCVGAHDSAESALQGVPRERPDVLILDLGLPGRGGLECVGELKSLLPTMEILVLTVHDDPQRLYQALEGGASGYLVKPVPPTRILEALQEIRQGGSPMSSQIARMVIKTFHRRGASRRGLEELTSREEEILQLLAEGYQNKEIADRLGVAVSTIATHLHNIYQKLHVGTRAEAVVKYLQGEASN